MPRGEHANHARANRQHRWNEDKMIAMNGYVKVRVGRSHPLADPNGYAYEHKLVWVAAGKTVMPGCVIHHINEVKTDNRIENLEMLPRSVHNRHHNTGKPRNNRGQFGKKAAGSLLDGREWKEFPR